MVREELCGASETSPFGVVQSSPVQSGHAFRVRSLSVYQLPTAGHGGQLWAWASKHRYGISKNFLSLEFSLGEKKSLFVSITSTRLYC